MEEKRILLERFVKGVVDLNEISPFGVELPQIRQPENEEFKEISAKELTRCKDDFTNLSNDNNKSEKTKLSRLVYSMVRSHSFTNCEIEIDDVIFNCHLFVLQAYSLYFRNEEIIKNGNFKIKLPSIQVTRKAFSTLYYWMINDNPSLKRNGIIELYNASCYLKINELEKQCLELLEDENNFIEDVAFQIFLEARIFKLNRIKSIMLSRIRKFFLIVIATVEYLDLDVNEICELISRSEICVHNETQVLMSAIRWIHHDWINRKKYLIKVMKCVRFELMTPFDLCAIQSRALDECENELQVVISNHEVQNLIQIGLSYVTMTYQCPMMKNIYYRNDYKRNEPEHRTWIKDPYFIERVVKPNDESISFLNFLKFLEGIRDPKLELWKKFQIYSICPNENLKMYRILKDKNENDGNDIQEKLLKIIEDIEQQKINEEKRIEEKIKKEQKQAKIHSYHFLDKNTGTNESESDTSSNITQITEFSHLLGNTEDSLKNANVISGGQKQEYKGYGEIQIIDSNFEEANEVFDKMLYFETNNNSKTNQNFKKIQTSQTFDDADLSKSSLLGDFQMSEDTSSVQEIYRKYSFIQIPSDAILVDDSSDSQNKPYSQILPQSITNTKTADAKNDVSENCPVLNDGNLLQFELDKIGNFEDVTSYFNYDGSSENSISPKQQKSEKLLRKSSSLEFNKKYDNFEIPKQISLDVAYNKFSNFSQLYTNKQNQQQTNDLKSKLNLSVHQVESNNIINIKGSKENQELMFKNSNSDTKKLPDYVKKMFELETQKLIENGTIPPPPSSSINSSSTTIQKSTSSEGLSNENVRKEEKPSAEDVALLLKIVENKNEQKDTFKRPKYLRKNYKDTQVKNF